MNNKNVPHSIGIIGAGIAGLTCGLELQKRGFQVELFDKGFNLGGRLATRYASRTDPSVYFDHGAQYFTAKSDVFHRQILAWVEEQTAALWSGRVGSVEKGNFEPEKQTHERFVGAPLIGRIISSNWSICR